MTKSKSGHEEIWERLIDAFRTDNASRIAKRISTIHEVTQQSVSNWKNGKALPARDALRAIETVTGISGDWLLTGIGEKYLQPSAKIIVQSRVESAPLVHANLAEGVIQIPDRKIYELTAAAARTEQAVSEGTAMVMADLLRNYRPTDVIAFILASDDFVSDGYRRGRHLFCVPCREGEPQDGDEVIVKHKDKILIRIFREHPGNVCLDHLLSHSPTLYLHARDVRWMYRVIG